MSIDVVHMSSSARLISSILRTLQSWQEHNSASKRHAANSRCTHAKPSAAARAVQAWHRISKRGRNALLTMNIERVYVLEDQVLEFVDSVRPGPFSRPGVDQVVSGEAGTELASS
jgi:uncharacterized protein YjiS (DUF1127 family)